MLRIFLAANLSLYLTAFEVPGHQKLSGLTLPDSRDLLNISPKRDFVVDQRGGRLYRHF